MPPDPQRIERRHERLAPATRWYLGDSEFEELFQELDRRSSFSTPCAVSQTFSTAERLSVIPLFATALPMRAASCLILPGASDWESSSQGCANECRKEQIQYLQRLHYDTALSASEYALTALRQFVPPTQILFGSDYPKVPENVVRAETSGLETSKILDGAARSAIERGNALRLFPRFARSA